MLRDLLAREFPPPRETSHDRQRARTARTRRPLPDGPGPSPHGRTDVPETEGRALDSASVARATKRSSTAAAASSASRRTPSSPSSAGRPASTARSYRASTLCAPSVARAVPDIAIRAAGGDILLRLDTWGRSRRALRAIDAVEALGLDSADVFARSLAAYSTTRLMAGQESRAPTRRNVMRHGYAAPQEIAP